MKKITTTKFLIKYKEKGIYSVFSREPYRLKDNILRDCYIYYRKGNKVFDNIFDEIEIRDKYVICGNRDKNLIIILFEDEDTIIKITDARYIDAQKNYFIVETKIGFIRVFDKKGCDIFSFEGSFCFGKKETVFVCNNKYIVTQDKKCQYHLYDCLNKKSYDIGMKDYSDILG